MEIYNERVRDLLAMSDKKVRHFEALHCKYVGGCVVHAQTDF